MIISEIYQQLDAIRDMVDQNANSDGTIDIDETMAGIVLEYAVVQMKIAIENGKSPNPSMDIARLMKISHKTVAYRKQMAMKKLRILLEGTEDGR